MGSGANDSFGYSVSLTGDINGDGYADLFVGAPAVEDASGNIIGKTYLYYGRSE